MSKIINSSQRKIINIIFKNPGINLRGIIEATKLSPNYVLEYVNYLTNKKILKEERLDRKGRVYLRRFFLDFHSELTKSLYLLVKEEEKEEFFSKYKSLRPIFEQIIEEVKEIDFLIVYGSYARLSAEKNSDIDILIVGKFKNKDRIKELLVNFDAEPSIKVESLEDFKKMMHENLHKNIMREGIVIYDSGKFINMISKQQKY